MTGKILFAELLVTPDKVFSVDVALFVRRVRIKKV